MEKVKFPKVLYVVERPYLVCFKDVEYLDDRDFENGKCQVGVYKFSESVIAQRTVETRIS